MPPRMIGLSHQKRMQGDGFFAILGGPGAPHPLSLPAIRFAYGGRDTIGILTSLQLPPTLARSA